MFILKLWTSLSALFVSELLFLVVGAAGEFCEAYVDQFGTYHSSFYCPTQEAWGSDLESIYCCGTSTDKYCCGKPASYFLENFNIGAFVGGSLAIVIAVIIGIIICCCCCSCCFWNRRQTTRRSMRNPPCRTVAYNAPHVTVTTTSTTPRVHQAPQPAPPPSNAYPKQYAPQPMMGQNLHHHQAPPPQQQQPYTPPPTATAPPMGAGAVGGAGGYPPPQPSPRLAYPSQQPYAPQVHPQQMHGAQPPPYEPTVPLQMQAPPLLDKGGYHLQSDMGGPSAPPPPTNPHYPPEKM